MLTYHRFIFVAKSGNCREPMAAGILKKYVFLEPVEIYARGLVVQFPEPLNQKAEAIMKSRNIDTNGFASAPLTRQEINKDTLVITLESRDKRRVKEMFPDLREDQVILLTEFVGEELETVDPYGMALANYGLCYENLYRSIKKFAKMMGAYAPAPAKNPEDGDK